MPLASTLESTDIALEQANLPCEIKLIPQRSYDVTEVCDVIMTVSGTVTLEIALMQKPMVIINKVAWLTYAIVSRMLKIDHIGLCNIVADKRLVPELIQHDARPDKIAGEVLRFLDDPAYHASVSKALEYVKERLGKVNATEQVAKLTLEMLDASE